MNRDPHTDRERERQPTSDDRILVEGWRTGILMRQWNAIVFIYGPRGDGYGELLHINGQLGGYVYRPHHH